MSGQLPADLLNRLTSALESLNETTRGLAQAQSRANDDNARSRPLSEGGLGGVLGNALAGAGGVAGLAGAGAQLANHASPTGQALGGAANVASGAASGFAAGGPVGAGVGAGVAGLQSLQQAGAAELAYEQAQIRLSDPGLNPVQTELDRKQLDINRDPRQGLRSVARGLGSPLGALVDPIGYAFGAPKRLEALLGPDPQLGLEQERIDRTPEIRAAARLQGAIREITSRGGTVSDEYAAAKLDFFLNAEEGVRGGDELLRDLILKRTGDRTGVAH